VNIFRILVVCVTLFGFWGSSFAISPKDIIKKVKEKYAGLTSLQAEFEQTFVWELAGESQTINGVIYLTQGNSYRVETDNQAVITDGKTVWTYSKESSHVIIDLLNKADENQLPKDLLFQYSEDYKPSIISEKKVDGVKIYVLDLQPKDKDSFITSMKIWVDSKTWFTTKIEQIDINNNINTYSVKNIRDDIELAEDLFKFEIPENTEIVDLRETK